MRLGERALEFESMLRETKARLEPDFTWYPYGSMTNVNWLREITPVAYASLLNRPKRIADIGAADGDMAFFFESVGATCDIYDNAPTNMNGLRGARLLKQTLNSNVTIHDRDLDGGAVIDGSYELTFLLGILYHLKNPFYVLEMLSHRSQHIYISTRIARHFTPGGPDVSQIPAAYLLSPTESNNDATNFWIFTEAGVKRIVDRAGFQILSCRTFGDTQASNPRDDDADERFFALLKSKRF